MVLKTNCIKQLELAQYVNTLAIIETSVRESIKLHIKVVISMT